MLNLRKAGKVYRAEGFVGGRRTRFSLGTRDGEAARRLLNRIERALSEGADSLLWPELRGVLPPGPFAALAALVGWREKIEKPEVTWADLLAGFEFEMRQRIALGKFAASTADRYRLTLREFSAFLSEKSVSNLKDITRPLVEAFKVWRKDRIGKRREARGATSIALDAAVLHRAFGYALENEMIVKNPVRMEGKPGGTPTRGAQPFTGEELQKLRAAAGEDRLAFLLLRHTGFRGSDAVGLTWGEIRFEKKEIERLTLKRKKLVQIPIHTELLFALETEFARRNPQPGDRVLQGPNGNPLRRPRLYGRMLALGARAGVAQANPHRFRDTLAVDLLAAGAGIYDVASMLGDTVETVERHYAPFVPALRERVRRIMESGAGLESGMISPSSSAKPS
ncbi:MAG: tyrosine-type recombinase/integrase [Candidatus Acidiferrum sp.]